VRSLDALLSEGDRIFGRGVDDEVGAHLRGKLQLLLGDVDRENVQSHRLRVLDRQMTEAADAGDDHPLAGLNFGFLEPLVDGYSGTQDRRSLQELHLVGQDTDEAGLREDVFGIAAVDPIACIRLAFAERLPTSDAVFAVPAGGM
jgi:hypothetical protein